MLRCKSIVGLAVVLCCALGRPGSAWAFGIYFNVGLDGGARWDAAARTADGLERSLDGGLRYSVAGGSYAAYRDMFTWAGTPPTAAQFQTAVEGAFGAWTAVDPVSRLTTDLVFTPDFGTAVDASVVNAVRLGAEIDLLAADDSLIRSTGYATPRGHAAFSAVSAGGDMTLTSGIGGYDGWAITGADISMNSNAGAAWTLNVFKLILTHEIGHALGLDDVDKSAGPAGNFIDDNYDPTSSATALATLTNSFAALVDVFDPSASPLTLTTVANGDPGVDTAGVDIMMEAFIPASLLGVAEPLSNDDYAGRQFLYPSTSFGASGEPHAPEPATAALLALAAPVFLVLRRRRRSR